MGASDRGPSVTWRSFGAARGLLAILALGLAFRLIIAYVLLPGSGFGVDRASFIGWANDLAAHGLTLWDVASTRFQGDREQWEPIVTWVN